MKKKTERFLKSFHFEIKRIKLSSFLVVFFTWWLSLKWKDWFEHFLLDKPHKVSQVLISSTFYLIDWGEEEQGEVAWWWWRKEKLYSIYFPFLIKIHRKVGDIPEKSVKRIRNRLSEKSTLFYLKRIKILNWKAELEESGTFFFTIFLQSFLFYFILNVQVRRKNLLTKSDSCGEF